MSPTCPTIFVTDVYFCMGIMILVTLYMLFAFYILYSYFHLPYFSILVFTYTFSPLKAVRVFNKISVQCSVYGRRTAL